MKTRHLLAALVLVAAPALGDPADDFYKEGLDAVRRGEIEEARAAFQSALKARPGHANARYQLGQLDEMKGELMKRKRERELQSVKIPELNISSATFSEALQLLSHLVETESTKQDKENPIVANFMVQDPTGKLGDRDVKLQLKNVPAKTAFDYLLAQAGATARYDEHAIVVRPAGGGTMKASE